MQVGRTFQNYTSIQGKQQRKHHVKSSTKNLRRSNARGWLLQPRRKWNHLSLYQWLDRSAQGRRSQTFLRNPWILKVTDGFAKTICKELDHCTQHLGWIYQHRQIQQFYLRLLSVMIHNAVSRPWDPDYGFGQTLCAAIAEKHKESPVTRTTRILTFYKMQISKHLDFHDDLLRTITFGSSLWQIYNATAFAARRWPCCAFLISTSFEWMGSD